MLVERQTDRHTYMLIAILRIPIGGEVRSRLCMQNIPSTFKESAVC